MTEAKSKKAKSEELKEAKEPVKVSKENKPAEKNEVKISKPKEEKEEEVSLEVEKDESGLEQLPEDIVKKLEKKKAENEQKNKKSKARRKKKKAIVKVPIGRAYVKASYNNTIVTLTDLQGEVISWASAGVAGFKGPKKATPYAAQIITRIAVGKARQEYGLSEVSVFVRGVGTGRESAVRSLNNNGLIVTSIQDVTPKPHNGCRARKPRRV
jgi:small subunit ribosomal protein S11